MKSVLRISLSLIFIILISSSCNPSKKAKKTQNVYKKVINKRFRDMLDKTSTADMSGVLDYMHPKIFSMVPRENLEEMMAGTFDDFNMVTQSLDIVNYSKPVEHGGETYILFEYISDMDIVFKGHVDEENLELYSGLFDLTYGEDNTTIEGKTMHVKVKDRTTFAIKHKEDGLWYFLENKVDNPMRTMMIPTEVIEALGLEK